MLGAVAPLAKILFNTIEKSVPDKDLQEKLKGLTKNGYNNLTKAQADTIVSTRSLIAEKKKEFFPDIQVWF